MIKIIFIFLSIFLYGFEIEVLGETSSSKNGIITINNGILIKDDLLISANQIIYNKNTKIVKAKGNVYLNYKKDNFLLSDNVIIELDSKNLSLKPFFIFNFTSDSWIGAKESINTDNKYILKNSVASTCNPTNPDWKIVSSSGIYNKKTKWFSLYNPTLYFKNLPILYLPYVGFSLDKTRRSGFLKPLLGFSNDEGWLFTLPYYQIFGEVADLEIAPTIRTKRGKGVYSTFRFVHSPTSYGEFKIGYFKDNEDFNKRFNLLRKFHRGWSFLYENSNIYENDKLYIDLKNGNDVDYFYLDAHNKDFSNFHLVNKILTSKINYYKKDKKNYIGIYGKYFKDTTKNSNSDTMQLLPQIQYHKFSSNIFNHFLYNIDANIYNYTREKGHKIVKKTFSIPVSYEFSMFENYVKFNIKEQFLYSQLNQTADINHSAEVYRSFSSNLFFKLYSPLSKSYKTFFHSIVPNVTFSLTNKSSKNIDNEYLHSVETQKNITFSLEQYLTSKQLNIHHTLSQTYYLYDNKTANSGVFNDLSIDYKDYYLIEKNRYNLSDGKMEYNSILIGYNNGEFNFDISHNYNNADIESLTLNSFYKFDEIHKIFGTYNYDLKLEMQKYWLLGISMKKKCWNYSISLKRETTPLLTNSGVSGIIRKTIYFQVELSPLGGIKQQYQFKTKEAEE